MRLPGDRLVQDVLDLGQLILAGARARADFAANLARRGDHHGNKENQRPAQITAETNHQCDCDQECKELLQKIAQHRAERDLHAIHIVDKRGKNCAGWMLVEKA